MTVCAVHHKAQSDPKHFKYSQWWGNALFLKLTTELHVTSFKLIKLN